MEHKEEGGWEGRLARYQSNFDVLSKGMADMGFHPYLDDDIQGCIITTYLFPDDKNFDFDVFYHSLSDKGIVYVCGDNMMTGWEAVLYCTVLCMLCVVEMTGWGASLLSPFTPM